MIADEATLARLMAASQQGDRNAYTVLLEEAQRWLTRYFRRKLPPQQVDDLVQDVLIAVHQKRATWDSSRAFLPWLAAIARYRWIDHLRKVYRVETRSLDGNEPETESDEDSVIARLSLDRLFENLPIAQAEAIEMVKVEGLSIREASQRSGQGESLIKVNIHRGLKKLAKIVEKAD
ncbi:hypothetical protein HME9302_01980 [Alteripontixanthobacter maritimus]|uniref:RNA polymerase subunit sigma-24 n=1 Tax=Alteripontixanthobacter maritimus TaxID=2161824 RepID=A0A369Q7S7_9SPHN|nr:sigma-70 family RNA polymerase sigma factor [Alteripontixanthobacter maritimus]RDC60764.1 hypothetical protein HME9302_01980 [Alteripontixanthobacter maritimus]